MTESKKTVRATVVHVSLSEGEKPGRIIFEMEDEGLRLMARIFGETIDFPINDDDEGGDKQP